MKQRLLILTLLFLARALNLDILNLIKDKCLQRLVKGIQLVGGGVKFRLARISRPYIFNHLFP